MPEPTNDAGTIQALLERLEEFRLPRALAVEKRVDAGETPTDEDFEFLKHGSSTCTTTSPASRSTTKRSRDATLD